MKARKLLCILLCLALLTGCSSRVTPATVASTLPPADPVYEAPHGTEGMAYTATVTLYLPSVDGSTLLAEYAEVELDRTQDCLSTVVEALLAHPGNSRVRSLGHGRALSLYGQDPVAVSGGICTVDLASAALQLEHEELYTVCLSIAATLGAFSDITHVNVLVCGQPVGLDIAGYLPVGAVSSQAGIELSTLWDMMSARATPLGQDASETPLSATATLYFPLADGTGIMPEARNITFAGQTPDRLASGLLSALSAGAQYLDGTSAMPDIAALMIKDPVTSEQADGSRLITLHFTQDLEGRLRLYGIEPLCFTAAVVYTLTTFIPSVSAVCIVSGETMMTNLYSRTLGNMTFRNGDQKRSQYSSLLREQVTIYLAQDGLLRPVSRTVAAASASDPSVLLSLLIEGPTVSEQAAGLEAVLPSTLSSSDLLGIAVADDTLLLNLS